MPAFDKTGPQGKGQMTGRGMGSCNNGRGFGFGCGCNMRRGLGRFFGGSSWSKSDLEEYRKALREEMEDVEKELGEADKGQE